MKNFLKLTAFILILSISSFVMPNKAEATQTYETTIDSTTTLVTGGTGGFSPSLLSLGANLLSVAYSDSQDDGWIKTISISSGVSVVDTLEYDTNTGRFPSLFSLDSTHFGVVYTGPGNDGYIETFSHSSGASITEIDSNEFEPIDWIRSNSVEINSTHFITAGYKYASSSNITFQVVTFSVDGSFVSTEIDRDIFTGSTPMPDNNNIIEKLSSTKYVVAFIDTSGNVRIATYTIDGSYILTRVDDITPATSSYSDVSIVPLDETHFMAIYTRNGADQTMQTFSVDSGNDNITLIDTWSNPSDTSLENEGVKIQDGVIAVARKNVSGDGILNIVTYDGSFIISQQPDLIFESGTITTFSPIRIAHLGSGKLAITYAERTLAPFNLKLVLATVNLDEPVNNTGFFNFF